MSEPVVDQAAAHRLILAVIMDAQEDWILDGPTPELVEFWSGPVYRHYLEMLDLPTHWLPLGVEPYTYQISNKGVYHES